MKTIVIWSLPTFCRFYGRVIPYYPHDNENKEFNSFYTHTKNLDIDDLTVIFEPNLKPMNYIDLVINSKNLYVMGHGSSQRYFGGRYFYEFYTLYTKQGISNYLQNMLIEEKCKETLHKLESTDQVKIYLDNDL